MNGLTGKLEFNDFGERKHNRYKIINVQKSGVKEVGTYEDGEMKINGKIIWPGETTQIPKGTFLSKHLRVGIHDVDWK